MRANWEEGAAPSHGGYGGYERYGGAPVGGYHYGDAYRAGYYRAW